MACDPLLVRADAVIPPPQGRGIAYEVAPTPVMLRRSPGLVRASLEARTVAALPVSLDHPSRLAPLAPQDDVVKCDCSPPQPGEGLISPQVFYA
jgi:hypothetical protein